MQTSGTKNARTYVCTGAVAYKNSNIYTSRTNCSIELLNLVYE